jgi:hypothetical protein
MRIYHGGKEYLNLVAAAKYMADKINKSKDDRVIDRIYSEYIKRIRESNFQYERAGRRTVIVKKTYLDSLVEEFRNIFYNLEIKEAKNVLLLDNLEIIKDLLAGKYDDIIDLATKKKLIQRLAEKK